MKGDRSIGEGRDIQNFETSNHLERPFGSRKYVRRWGSYKEIFQGLFILNIQIPTSLLNIPKPQTKLQIRITQVFATQKDYSIYVMFLDMKHII